MGCDSLSVAIMPAMARRPPRPIVRIAGWVVVLTLIGAVLSISGCMESMFYMPAREATPAAMGPPGTQLVRFSSRDGTQLSAWFIPPQGSGDSSTPPEPSAAVLHLHGNAGSIRSHAFFSEHLPRAGFAVMILDYRGYGESKGRARRRGPMLEDAHAALDALLARDDVDPQRVALFGQSLGGAFALLLAAERPEVAAVMLESPFASWREIAADALGGGAVARFAARLLISDELRPVDAAAQIDRPMLVIHGDSDRIIPVAHGRRVSQAAPQSTLHVLPGADHNSLRSTHPESDRLQIEFLRRMLAEDVPAP